MAGRDAISLCVGSWAKEKASGPGLAGGHLICVKEHPALAGE